MTQGAKNGVCSFLSERECVRDEASGEVKEHEKRARERIIRWQVLKWMRKRRESYLSHMPSGVIEGFTPEKPTQSTQQASIPYSCFIHQQLLYHHVIRKHWNDFLATSIHDDRSPISYTREEGEKGREGGRERESRHEGQKAKNQKKTQVQWLFIGPS